MPPAGTSIVPDLVHQVVGLPDSGDYASMAHFRDRLRESYRYDRRGRIMEACRRDMQKYATEKLDGGRKLVDTLVAMSSNFLEPAAQAFAIKTLTEMISGKAESKGLKSGEKKFETISDLIARAQERREEQQAEIIQMQPCAQ